MRLDKQCFYAGMITAAVALGACRSGTPDTSSADSAVVPAQADTTQPPSSSATTPPTVRSDSVVLQTDKTAYKAGDQMALTLENKSASGYAFNPCTRGIEREDGGAWTAVAEPNRMCTMEAWILDPRGTKTGNTELPTPLVPGRYRVVVRLTLEAPGAASNTAVTAVSDPITVS